MQGFDTTLTRNIELAHMRIKRMDGLSEVISLRTMNTLLIRSWSVSVWAQSTKHPAVFFVLLHLPDAMAKGGSRRGGASEQDRLICISSEPESNYCSNEQ